MLPNRNRDLEALKKQTFTMEELVGVPEHYRDEGAKAERDAILRFLRAEHAKFDKASQDKALSEDGRDRCSTRAALLETMIAYIERGDHLKAE